MQLIIGFILGAFVAFASYKVKFLTRSGATATFLLAGTIFGIGGIKWSVPILTFFILSSILSKIRKKNTENTETYFEKSGIRDHMQVIANGGIGGILVVYNNFYPDELFFYMYIASLAAVCADTWATEIGTYKKSRTYNIINFKPVKQGMSGGISLLGTIGSFLGATTIALSGFPWIADNHLSYFLIIIACGIGGSLFDSLLGATIQVQYYCGRCDKITEKIKHCDQKSEYYRGYLWLNNDLVNLFAGLAGTIIVTIYFISA